MEITLKGYKCERCEHTWVPVSEEKPKVCPKCKSPYWDTPRKSEKANLTEMKKYR